MAYKGPVRFSFAADMQKFADKLERTLDQTHRAVVIKMFSTVIMLTPVEEGTLRGGWVTSVGRPSDAKPNRRDPMGVAAIAEVQANPGHAGEVSYLTNSQPYAIVAELGLWGTGPGATERTTRDGYSIQAPYGMVRITTQRFDTIIKEAIRETKRKVR